MHNKKTILYLSILTLIISQIACAVSVIESTITPLPHKTTATLFIYPITTIEKNIKIGIISNCLYLNMRISPNDTSQILLSIPAGEKVEIIGELKDKWYPVIYKNVYIGYVYSDYLMVQYP